jgi:hypothetical protein
MYDSPPHCPPRQDCRCAGSTTSIGFFLDSVDIGRVVDQEWWLDNADTMLQMVTGMLQRLQKFSGPWSDKQMRKGPVTAAKRRAS